MSHNYLLGLYAYIDERLESARRELQQTEDPRENALFQKGRMEALAEVRSFITSRFEAKLPRRIYRQLQKTAHK